jgi:hypothetical protein
MTDTADVSDVVAARRLDGNEAAGVLAELFAVDLTEARSRCASCGSTAMIGAHYLYADTPALVLAARAAPGWCCASPPSAAVSCSTCAARSCS